VKGKKIALLGATGFLGKQMLLDLVDSGFRVTIVSRRSKNYLTSIPTRTMSLTEFLSSDEEFDHIINCAGYYSKSTRISDVYKTRKSNYLLIKKLIQFREKNGGSLITFGSYFEHVDEWRNKPAKHYTKYKKKSKKILKTSAKNISSPTFYIYLFDTYGNEDNRNKVLTYLISEFKAGRIPILKTSLESINWSHKADIAESITALLKDSNKYASHHLHEFQIRSLDEFRLVDFVNTISSRLSATRSNYKKDLKTNNLSDCAPNLTYFKAKNNVIDFTLDSIHKE
jgi:nucleoside-diphosphate-sugar epimerase